jgi:hypothetical protein
VSAFLDRAWLNVIRPRPSAWCPKTPLTTSRRLAAVIPVHLLVVSLLGWFQSEQYEIIQYLPEENHVPKEPLRTSRVRFADHQRRRLAGLGAPLGRRLLVQIAHDCDVGHALALASAPDRAEVDVLDAPAGPAERAPGDSASGPADGNRESGLGLSATPRRPQESWPSSGAIDDRDDSKAARGPARAPERPTSWQTSAGALGCARRGGFLHDRSLDGSRPCHVLHAVCHRIRVAAPSHHRFDTTSG